MRGYKTTLLTVFVIILGFAVNSWAIPDLQIYVPGATYKNETWVINSYDYDLWVIGANLDVYDVKIALAFPTDEEGSIEVTWKNPTASDYGTGSVTTLTMNEAGSTEYSAYYDSYASEEDPDPSTYGFAQNSTPFMGDGDEVPPHGVFPTDFYEYFIGDFGTDDTVHNYIPGSEWEDEAPGEIKIFGISVTGYSVVDIMAYDHVIKSNNKAKYVFTPLSHDGSSEVPEPAMLLLLGSGLLGLWGFRKLLSKRTT